ncbi:MAG TPA: FAD-linked oxidase C-terminal domain-containing protein [candidate division Zixibacteria bacterium]|nr:FAD-linked oxidase C-terminal domain-containing protein [candidate division Zixibacteria bacterium]
MNTFSDIEKLRPLLSPAAELIVDLTGDYEKYRQDATEEQGNPAAAVLAASEADVIATMLFARERGLAVVPRGAGTGLSGGAVPAEGSIVLSVERMNEIRIDPKACRAVCGPGTITKDLLDAAAPYDLTYPPDPASYLECSLGGNVAENAGGLRCKRFGVTRDYVLGLRAITVEGTVLKTGCYNNNRGFNLGDLLIGSEGTLAIVTEMTLRLIPTPLRGSCILIAFDAETDAAQSVAQITRAGVIPTVMEYLDRDAAACSNRYEKTEGLDDVAAILLIETQGERDREQLEQVTEISRGNHCSFLRIEHDPAKIEELWRVRRNLSKAIRDVAIFRYNEDVAVPVSQFMTLIGFVAAENAAGPLRINAFGHAGDGNLHVSFLSMTGSNEEIALIAAARERLYRKTIELGGTLSGEHGIGSHKGVYLPWEFDAVTLGAMRSLKDLFDPTLQINPGKIFATL